MQQLLELMTKVPKAAAIIDRGQLILERNNKFAELFGSKTRGQLAGAFLAEGTHLSKLNRLLGGQGPGWAGAEITLSPKAGPPILCWCETHSLIADGALVHFLEILEVEQYHALEAAYLHQLRRVLDDNLLILDDEGYLVWVRADNKAYENYKGRPSQELIFEADRLLWQSVLREAKTLPGQAREAQVRAASDGSARFVDICYLPSLVGGRYYVASRSTAPTGSRIILRLKEAWLVSTDRDLATKLGTKQSAISRANLDETVPPGWLVTTGQVTGFSLDWLLTGQGAKRRL